MIPLQHPGGARSFRTLGQSGTRRIQRHCRLLRPPLPPRDEVVITSARLGLDSPLVGAAELAFAPLLDDPQTVAAALSGSA